jgi:prepilin-type N-terminal cleavage/methylation domain-containing protein
MGNHRPGFTLIEVVIAMVAMLIVSGAVYRLLTTTRRLSWAQAEQLQVQSTVRSAALVVLNELRELNGVEGGGTGENDLVSIAPTAVTYRAARGFGLTCQTGTSSQLRIQRPGYAGHRDPQALRDSAYVLSNGATWLPFAITAVSTSGVCPGTGALSMTLTVLSTAALAGIPVGTPVRIYEIMELRLYRSEGKSWLGMRSVSSGETIQPLAGPLADADGLRFDYFDKRGLPTSVVTQVKSIGVTLRGYSEGTSNFGALRGEPAKEELAAQIAIRNALQ